MLGLLPQRRLWIGSERQVVLIGTDRTFTVSGQGREPALLPEIGREEHRLPVQEEPTPGCGQGSRAIALCLLEPRDDEVPRLVIMPVRWTGEHERIKTLQVPSCVWSLLCGAHDGVQQDRATLDHVPGV